MRKAVARAGHNKGKSSLVDLTPAQLIEKNTRDAQWELERQAKVKEDVCARLKDKMAEEVFKIASVEEQALMLAELQSTKTGTRRKAAIQKVFDTIGEKIKATNTEIAKVEKMSREDALKYKEQM